MKNYDFGIIGGGIVGLTLAFELQKKFKNKKIAIFEKEKDVAFHASGRNSGVLHAGFYYTANSLKAKFTADGNIAMKEFCKSSGLKINTCGKLVVAKNKEERERLYELKKRGDANSATVSIISEKEAKKLEPNIATYKEALWSPNTASVDPKKVSMALREKLENLGVDFYFENSFKSFDNKILETSKNKYKIDFLINAAGLYADKISQSFRIGKNFTLIPFKGVYLEIKPNTIVNRHIYPVPDLRNPFLGVHFTQTVDKHLKIGPTAIPAFWRENYEGLNNFSLSEMTETLFYESKLFFKNSFNFRNLAFEEIQKYMKSRLIFLAKELVPNIEKSNAGFYLTPGIRAQLLDKRDNSLVQDFIIEKKKNSLHVLNAVSPGFTTSFSFAKYVIKKYLL